MGPLAVSIAIWLALSRALKGAGAWLALFAAAAILVVGTKVAYIGWGIGIREIDFTGISGHAMISTATLAIAGYLAGSGFGPFAAWPGAGVGLGIGVLIGLSRVILGIHSPSEVAAGCALGAIVALASAALIEAPPKGFVGSAAFAATIVALVIIQHGDRVPSERLITKVSLFLSGRSAPYIVHGRWL
jgi:membrane-associated phospholipid phosphatase